MIDADTRKNLTAETISALETKLAARTPAALWAHRDAKRYSWVILEGIRQYEVLGEVPPEPQLDDGERTPRLGK